MERFVGKAAVVTGAGGGISSAIIKELLKRNVNVIGLDIKKENLKILEEELSKNTHNYKGKFHLSVCDITNEQQVCEAFETIPTDFGPLSILVNGAGVLLEDKETNSTQPECCDSTFAVNMKGLFLCCNQAMKLMKQNSVAGHIINFCSIGGLDGYHYKGFRIYNASKYAARSFSNSLRREITLSKTNIKITIMNPGSVKTGLILGFYTAATHAKGNFLNPSDTANACMFVLDTPPNVLVSEMNILPIHQEYF